MPGVNTRISFASILRPWTQGYVEVFVLPLPDRVIIVENYYNKDVEYADSSIFEKLKDGSNTPPKKVA